MLSNIVKIVFLFKQFSVNLACIKKLFGFINPPSQIADGIPFSFQSDKKLLLFYNS